MIGGLHKLTFIQLAVVTPITSWMNAKTTHRLTFPGWQAQVPLETGNLVRFPLKAAALQYYMRSIESSVEWSLTVVDKSSNTILCQHKTQVSESYRIKNAPNL